MDVSSASQAQTVQSQTNSSTAVGGTTMGQDDFLQLLVAQMQNQDPLEPQSGTEFTAQLAQFASLEQMFNTNSLLEQLAALQAAVANTETAGFIGREITAYGNEITISGETISQGEFVIDTPADEVTVTIRDDSGSVVRVLELGEVAAGTHTIAWDGANEAGAAVGNGTYTFSVSATAGEEEIATETHIRGTVEGVDFDITGTYLIVTGQRVALGDLIGVRAVEESEESVSA